ncbi:hypothetical protein MTO96_015073 [Rhipicephalus appendiculatus]
MLLFVGSAEARSYREVSKRRKARAFLRPYHGPDGRECVSFKRLSKRAGRRLHRMAVAAAFPCQMEKRTSEVVFELTDADVGILFDCAAGVRPQAVGCHIPADVPYVQLCGQPVCRSRFSRTQLTRLFWTVRSKIVALQNDSGIHRGSFGSGGASQLHYEVSSFLSFIRHEVERVADSASTRMENKPSYNRDAEWLDPRELCFCLLDELRLTLRLTGRLSDIPVDKNHCRSNDNRRFHVALEVWWTALRVADIVMSSHLLRGAEISFCDLGGFGQNALFAQVAVLFLADLCCLSSRFFQVGAVVAAIGQKFVSLAL